VKVADDVFAVLAGLGVGVGELREGIATGNQVEM